MKDILGELKDLFEEMQRLQNMNFIYYKEEVDSIINNKVVDKMKIERMLDYIMSLFPTPDTTRLYNRLCDYYSTIDKEASNDYKTYYKKMYED